MSGITKGLTVDLYDKLVQRGVLPETNRFELIEGRIVEKDMKGSLHRVAVQRTLREIVVLLPPGWYAAKEEPVRIPSRRSELEPDVSVVRGSIDDYTDHHPGPDDVALVVEVTRSSLPKTAGWPGFTPPPRSLLSGS
jgi:Uma2 family endonuclease